MPDKFESYVNKRLQEFDQISAERQATLKELAVYISAQLQAKQPANLTFICTHNSRRSQMAQVWAAVAAAHYNIRGVNSYSGGTEATAFNPRTVAALERAGLLIDQQDQSMNPHYGVKYAKECDALICFSKVYNEKPNPKEDFCAVMTCSHADENCPVVTGGTARISLPYDDPKAADDSPEELQTYDARCAEICREMLYALSQVER